MCVARVDVPDRLSVFPSPHSILIDVTVPPSAELLRVRVMLVPVLVVEGPFTVSDGGRLWTVRRKVLMLEP